MRTRVLLAERQQLMREGLASLLGRDPALEVVAQTGDGAGAVQAAQQLRPDVAVIDLQVPGMNGVDATRRIREHPWGRGMVIVALTGWGQEGDRERSREAGCDGHLVKPVGLSDLETLLRDLAAPDTR